MKISKVRVAVVITAGMLFAAGCKKDDTQLPAKTLSQNKFIYKSTSMAVDSSGGENPGKKP